MSKAKSLFATVLLGFAFAACATGPADDVTTDQQSEQSEHSAPADVPDSLQLEPNACLPAGSCLLQQACSKCCSGKCTTRNGCPETQRACQ